MDSLSSKKRVRHDSDESGVDSVEAKRILLDILDDSDVSPVTHDLDSFMKSFQDEISPSPEPAGVTADRPELGFLFEASDDELGLPPTDSNTSLTGFENTRVATESVELSELLGTDDQFLSYDSFEYEFAYDDVNNFNNYNNGEYVALDGLFDHTDLGFGSSDVSWRSETLPAQ